MKIYTIGTGGKPAKQFFDLLINNGIQKLLDIRLKNQSPLLGYTRGRDLSFFLTELFSIAYEHIPELAPTYEILQNFRDKKRKDTYNRWDIYENEFNKLLSSRETMSIFNKAVREYEIIALLCSEPKATKCHRRLVTEYLAKQNSSISIIHI